MPIHKPKLYLTTPQVCVVLGIPDRRKVIRMLHRGEIKGKLKRGKSKWGDRWLISYDSLEKILKT